jgi:hypothetical protein
MRYAWHSCAFDFTKRKTFVRENKTTLTYDKGLSKLWVPVRSQATAIGIPAGTRNKRNSWILTHIKSNFQLLYGLGRTFQKNT